MGFTGVLLYFPAFPYNIDVLRPSLPLASLAAALIRDGHRAQIMDLGTVETFERLFPHELRSPLLKAAESLFKEDRGRDASPLSVRWKLRGLTRCVHSHQEVIASEIGDELCARRELDFLALRVNKPSELAHSLWIAQRVRERKSDCTLIAYGPGVSTNSRGMRRLARVFDCILPGESPEGLCRIIDTIHKREAWMCVPGLILGGRGHSRVAPAGPPLDPLPMSHPAYAPQTYSSLGNATKVKVFDLEHIIVNSNSGSTMTGPRMGAKSVAMIAEEVVRLKRMYGAHAFHFLGSAAFSKDPEMLALEFLHRRFPIRYSREAHIAGMSARAISSLKASGCHAITFRVDSGSQRLLEEYFNHPFSASQAERVLRTARFMDIHVSALLTYPTDVDDYHTKEETLRIVKRTRPHSVQLEFPSTARKKQSTRLRNTAEREQGLLRKSIEASGVSTRLSPQMALMAALCDYKSRENEFCSQLMYQFFTGDVIGVATTVELINRNACTPSHALSYGSGFPHENVVGN